MRRSRTLLFLLCLCGLASGRAGAQLTPTDRLRELYAPMDAVLDRSPSLRYFLEHPNEVADYARAFEQSELGRRWRGKPWVKLHIGIKANQMRTVATGFSVQMQNALMAIRPSVDRLITVPGNSGSSEPLVLWAESGSEFWHRRWVEMTQAMEGRSASPYSPDLLAITTRQRARWRQHDADWNPYLVEAAIDLLAEQWRRPSWQNELAAVDNPALVQSTLNRLGQAWFDEVEHMLSHHLGAQNLTEIRSMAGSLLLVAKARLRWPTRRSFEAWTSVVPAAGSQLGLVELHRLIHDVLVGGILASECTSGGMEYRRPWIHPHDYLLPILRGVRIFAVLQWPTSGNLEGPTRYRGSVSLFPLVRDRAPPRHYGLGSRLRFQELESVAPILREAALAVGAQKLIIASPEQRADNSGVFALLRDQLPETPLVFGNYQLAGSARMASGIGILRNRGELLRDQPFVDRPIVPGVMSGTIYTLQIDPAALDLSRARDRIAVVADWLPRVEERILNGSPIPNGGALIEHLQFVAERFPVYRLRILTLMATLLGHESILVGRVETARYLSRVGLEDESARPLASVALGVLLRRLTRSEYLAFDAPEFTELLSATFDGLDQLVSMDMDQRAAILPIYLSILISDRPARFRAMVRQHLERLLQTGSPRASLRLPPDHSAVLFARYLQEIALDPEEHDTHGLRIQNALIDPQFLAEQTLDLATVRHHFPQWLNELVGLFERAPHLPEAIRTDYRRQLQQWDATRPKGNSFHCTQEGIIEARLTQVMSANRTLE